MPTCTPLSTTTTFYGLCLPANGERDWGTAYRTSMQTIDTTLNNLANQTPRSYLAGLEMTRSATSISIAAGACIGNDQATSVVLSSALSKTTSTWAVGSGNGGGFAGALSNSTWYHVFLIKRTDTNVVDAGFSTSLTAADIPTNYTIYRRIGSVRMNNQGNFADFTQDGDYFRFATANLDVATNAPGTNAVTPTLLIPTGVNVWAIINLGLAGAALEDTTILVTDPSATDVVPSQSTNSLVSIKEPSATGGNNGYVQMEVRSNTSSQIRYRMAGSSANQTIYISTLGWWDRRGRDD